MFCGFCKHPLEIEEAAMIDGCTAFSGVMPIMTTCDTVCNPADDVDLERLSASGILYWI